VAVLECPPARRSHHGSGHQSGLPIYAHTAWIADQLPALYDPLQRTGEVPVARERRKLAAILAADVVGYSRLMGRDESGTLAHLAAISSRIVAA
jgi:class 3 adenylate cyclase